MNSEFFPQISRAHIFYAYLSPNSLALSWALGNHYHCYLLCISSISFWFEWLSHYYNMSFVDRSKTFTATHTSMTLSYVDLHYPNLVLKFERTSVTSFVGASQGCLGERYLALPFQDDMGNHFLPLPIGGSPWFWLLTHTCLLSTIKYCKLSTDVASGVVDKPGGGSNTPEPGCWRLIVNANVNNNS